MTISKIDRFLVFYLTIKYQTIYSPERLLKLLAFIHVFSLSMYICFVCSRVIEWLYFFNISFISYFIWDVIYMILVIATYSYIFCVYKKRMGRIKSQARFKSSNKKHFKLRTPTLIIVTFIIFVCIPDFINIFTHFQYLEGKGVIYQILGVFYRIAWLIDPLIYIYDCKLFKGKRFSNRIQSNVVSQAKTRDL